ncbi:hypothetical protein LOCC1_G007147 [Lachnellula occidentalis]|uniref:Uncharacterized protein n=1 Tax=Lachnellula occidentalis TaxID=215460 RepID=A0A8H8RIS5_9HELO|nr:hypothetical protein LOCC1_G007147 [Lachnellula occidentalis]
MPEKDEKHVEVPLLEDYDATIPDSQPEADESLSPTPKSKPIPTLKRRALRLFIFCIWFYAVFMGSFYFFSFLGDQYDHTLDVLKTTALKTYGGITDTYQSITNPATREEVVDLMTELYELLAEMGYYDAAMIGRPPHSPGINRTLAAELEFSREAVEMMEMLPYLLQEEESLGWGGDNKFLLSGTFADLRDDGVLDFTRDPMFAIDDLSKGFDEDGGKYMRPDYICLMKLWTIDQENMGLQADPALKNIELEEGPGNMFSPENAASRLARDALRDYIHKFRTLEWIPGGNVNGTWEGDEYTRLYKENGWPESFNSTAFNIAREQWEEDDMARWDAEAPFQEVWKLDYWIQIALNDIDEKRRMIADVAAGMEIPPDKADREVYKQELQEEVKKRIESLPKLQAELEVAREVLKSIDPEVKRAREERMRKYGN